MLEGAVEPQLAAQLLWYVRYSPVAACKTHSKSWCPFWVQRHVEVGNQQSDAHTHTNKHTHTHKQTALENRSWTHVYAYGLKTEPACCMFLLWGQRGGVGWGGVITFICTSSHIWCYVIVPHVYDAMLLCGVGWGGVITFICTSSHKWCHVIVPHIYDATLLCLTHMMLRCCNIVLALPHRYDATLL